MKLQHLFEKHDPSSEPFVEKICKMLFIGINAGAVTDPKRKGEYFGVANGRSVITDQDGNNLTMTFDNSTTSGEFELNSLTPLGIVKGSALNQEVMKLYKEHDVKSSKKLGYIDKDGDLVLREIHFGKLLDENALNFVMDLLANLKHASKNKPKSK